MDMTVGPVAGHLINGFDVAIAPPVTAGLYTANDIMGGLMTFPVARVSGAKIVIKGVQIACKANVTPILILVLFNADPAATTKTDNAPYALAAADVFKVIASVEFVAADWTDHGAVHDLRRDNLEIVANPAAAAENIYALLIDGTGVTLASTSDIQVRLRGLTA